MNNDQYRHIVVRAFVATGKDGGPGLVYYIDQLERAVLHMDKKLMKRKQSKSRKHLEEVMREHDDRT